MPPQFDAAALCLALGSIVRAVKPTRRATQRCAKRMARALSKLHGISGISGEYTQAEQVFERTCQACGRCEALGVTRRVPSQAELR